MAAQHWEAAGWSQKWTRDLGLDHRGMRFAREVGALCRPLRCTAHGPHGRTGNRPLAQHGLVCGNRHVASVIGVFGGFGFFCCAASRHHPLAHPGTSPHLAPASAPALRACQPIRGSALSSPAECRGLAMHTGRSISATGSRRSLIWHPVECSTDVLNLLWMMQCR